MAKRYSIILILYLTNFPAQAETLKAPEQVKNDFPNNWTEEVPPFHVAGPVYYVGTKGLGVYLIKTSAGLILLNGAMPGSAKEISDSIKKLGFRLNDIKIILISQAHIDHVGTIADFKKTTGARLAVMDADVELLISGGSTDYLYSKKPSMHFQGVKADRILKDGEIVSLGGVSLIAHKTPGHTPGCTTWETNFKDAGRNYKIIFADGTGVNPGTQFNENPSYRGIVEDYQKTFKVLTSLKPDIFLSYHAEFFDLNEKLEQSKKDGLKAWIDSEGYRKRIAKKKADFEAMLKINGMNKL